MLQQHYQHKASLPPTNPDPHNALKIKKIAFDNWRESFSVKYPKYVILIPDFTGAYLTILETAGLTVKKRQKNDT